MSTDVALANLEKEKQLSFIRAWEESEKSKVDNKYGFLWTFPIPSGFIMISISKKFISYLFIFIKFKECMVWAICFFKCVWFCTKHILVK